MFYTLLFSFLHPHKKGNTYILLSREELGLLCCKTWLHERNTAPVCGITRLQVS